MHESCPRIPSGIYDKGDYALRTFIMKAFGSCKIHKKK
jgi:hypothetical protein